MKIKIIPGEIRGLRCVRCITIIPKSKKLGIFRKYQKTRTVKTVAPNFTIEEMRASFEAEAKRWEAKVMAKIEREKLGVLEAKPVQEEIKLMSYYATLQAAKA